MDQIAEIRQKATLSVPEACKVLGVSRSHGFDLIKRGEFPCRVIRLGQRTVVVAASLLELLEAQPQTEAAA